MTPEARRFGRIKTRVHAEHNSNSHATAYARFNKVGLEDLSSRVNPEVLSPGEVKLKAIDLFNTWRMTKTTEDLLGPPTPIAQWHDRMAALFEAKSAGPPPPGTLVA